MHTLEVLYVLLLSSRGPRSIDLMFLASTLTWHACDFLWSDYDYDMGFWIIFNYYSMFYMKTSGIGICVIVIKVCMPDGTIFV